MNSSNARGRHPWTDVFLARRRHRAIHYAVVAVTTAAILFVYYAYKASLPTPPGHYLGWFWNVFYFEFKNNVLGIVMLVPILYAALTLGWRHSSVVVLGLLAAIAPYIVSFSYSALHLFESFSLLVVPPALVISAEMLLTSNARERRAKAEKKRERAEVMRQMFSIQEDERRRISQELHDGVAQTLLVNASTAHALLEGNRRDPVRMRAALEAIKQNSLNMVAEIRCICQDLRPSILDNLGLVSAIKWLVDDLSQETGLSVRFDLTGALRELKQDENVAVFRIVQEALNNIKKHAGATQVKVSIAFDAAGMSISIEDDGRGFKMLDDVHRFALSGKLGILGMHERAQSIGAALDIRSGDGPGTEVMLRIDGKPADESAGETARP